MAHNVGFLSLLLRLSKAPGQQSAYLPSKFLVSFFDCSLLFSVRFFSFQSSRCRAEGGLVAGRVERLLRPPHAENVSTVGGAAQAGQEEMAVGSHPLQENQVDGSQE